MLGTVDSITTHNFDKIRLEKEDNTMNLADRIQHLRKIKGISQEEFADKIGVSRQAVSKWESEASIPDIDKIIIMSEYFGVSTDYILKGIESSSQINKGQVNANLNTVIATALNFIGLLLATTLWYDFQLAIATAVGILFMIVGCMIYCAGMVNGREDTKKTARYNFWRINIWILNFTGLSICLNLFCGPGLAPYPIYHDYLTYSIFWGVYILSCIVITYKLYESNKQKLGF